MIVLSLNHLSELSCQQDRTLRYDSYEPPFSYTAPHPSGWLNSPSALLCSWVAFSPRAMRRNGSIILSPATPCGAAIMRHILSASMGILSSIEHADSIYPEAVCRWIMDVLEQNETEQDTSIRWLMRCQGLRTLFSARYSPLAMSSDYRIDTEKIFRKHPFAREILDRLSAAGYEAFLIGGVVRDAVRSIIDPSVPFSPHEVDIATSALPGEVRRVFPDRPIVGVGEEFGVLVIAAPDSQQYEVATFRTEEEYDGRWPGKVELVRDLAGDVIRRDLTINGLAATR
ncbi:MAG TPA: hypothetical protein ENF88_00725, partial [Candidatus Acetothermia bacterium]|nr:hypothetical protein [Candidatus Acetothermia bacterium]HEX32198.1 hypothetical protein [Candidatus Acetothermia bacterium]